MSKFKNSADIRSYCIKKKVDHCVLPFKNGYAVVIGRRVREVFIKPDAQKRAKARLKELT